jgi:hypothetical protein
VPENTVDAQAGSSSDLVLHLTTAAADPPVVTQFPNDLAGVPSDKASVTVAHTAAVAPADIRVDGTVLFANVANGGVAQPRRFGRELQVGHSAHRCDVAGGDRAGDP